MAQPSQKELFEEIVMAGVSAIKTVIEREDLDEHLTPPDIHKIAEAVEHGVNNYVEFMSMAKKQAKE